LLLLLKSQASQSECSSPRFGSWHTHDEGIHQSLRPQRLANSFHSTLAGDQHYVERSALGYNWIDALPQQGGTRLDEHSSAFVVEKFRICRILVRPFVDLLTAA
jgi:hypothetical protein